MMLKSTHITSFVEYLTLLIGTIWVVSPIVWLILQSLTLRGYILELSLEKILSSLTFQNYALLFLESSILRYLRNSLLINGLSTLIVVIIGAMAGYAFSRYQSKLFENLKFWYLSTQMIPPICAVLPVFVMMIALDLVDTHQGLIWVYTATNLPFAVWMSAGFFEGIPKEIEEAFLVDGCTPFQAFLRMLPLIKGGLAATSVFTFLMGWNEFLFAFILTRFEAITLPVGLSQFKTIVGLEWGEMAAMGVFMLVPVIVLSAILQKHLIRGLTFGAVKE